MAPIENPWHSRPIDVHRWSDHPEVIGFVGRIWDEVLPSDQTSGPKPKTSFRNQLRVLILDLYVAWLEDPDLSIGVSMSSNAWDTNSRYNAIHLSKKLIPIIHALHKAGLNDLARGSYSGPFSRGNRTTRIRASDVLQDWFRSVQITRDDIGRAEGEEIIILRGEDDNLLEYEDTEDTNRMRDELTLYNQVIENAFIDIPELSDPCVGDVSIDHHHKTTRRIFSRGDWGLNGRFYGGWWQRLNSQWRSKIFINDTPCVEVDFRGLHVALLTLNIDGELREDPYTLDQKVLPGYPAALVRRFAKQLALTAINANSKDSAYRAFRDGFPAGNAGKQLKNEQLDMLLAAFLDKNSHLNDYLFSDQGIRLMFQDSKIAELVHRHFTNQNVPVLSVHDSFIIDYTRVAELKAVMAEASKQVAGHNLPTSNQLFGLDEGPARPPEVVLDYVNWRQTPRDAGYLDRLQAHEDRTGEEVAPYR